MPQKILADTVTSITNFKRNPMEVIAQANDTTLAVLSHNKPVFYCVTPEKWAALLDKLERYEAAEAQSTDEPTP